MTIRERIEILSAHGDFDPFHIAAILNVDVEVVSMILANPHNSFADPVPPGLLYTAQHHLYAFQLADTDEGLHILTLNADGTRLTLNGTEIVSA